MTATATTTGRMTAEMFFDFVHRPENTNRWFELVRGEVTELPPPQRTHGVVIGNLAWSFGNHTRQRRKGYITTNDSGVILERAPDTVRGPDLAYYEDADRFVDLHPKYGEVPPRLAVEVLSPTDKWSKVTRKIGEYLRSGVEIVWLIDPEDRTVTVYRLGQPPVVLEAADELTGGDVLPDFRCRVADLFLLPGDLSPAP